MTEASRFVSFSWIFGEPWSELNFRRASSVWKWWPRSWICIVETEYNDALGSKQWYKKLILHSLEEELLKLVCRFECVVLVDRSKWQVSHSYKWDKYRHCMSSFIPSRLMAQREVSVTPNVNAHGALAKPLFWLVASIYKKFTFLLIQNVLLVSPENSHRMLFTFYRD